MMIYNQDNAIKSFIDKLNASGNHAVVIADFNKGRHKLVETNTGERYYCVYKREFFTDFSKFHKSFCDSIGYFGSGESLNIESTNKAILNKASTLVFIHPDKIYTIYSNQFRNFAINNNLKGQTKTGEWRYSIPINMLTEME